MKLKIGCHQFQGSERLTGQRLRLLRGPKGQPGSWFPPGKTTTMEECLNGEGAWVINGRYTSYSEADDIRAAERNKTQVYNPIERLL